MLSLLFLLTALQVADAFLTVKILKGGGQELNPVMRWVMGKLGVVGAMAAVKTPFVLLVAAVWNENLTFWVCVLYIGVVGWNTYQVLKK